MEEIRTDLMLSAHRDCGVSVWQHGDAGERSECVAEEVPVALVYNGISHAVMLATPQNLEDFALGFSLSEGIVADRRDIFGFEISTRPTGIEVAMHLAGGCDVALRARRRALAGRSGCGLCGVESLEQAQCNPAPVAASGALLTPDALAAAAAALRRRQRLHNLTGATHAAAWCGWDGGIVCVREDIGRHNALDKLIGALAVAGIAADSGFVLMTSRASYEIVCKAAAVGIGLVAAVSAPTALAIDIAQSAGMTLVGFLRDSRFTVYAHPQRLVTAAGAERKTA